MYILTFLNRKITADIIGGGRFNSVEELQKMEETLQGGLGRVLRTRVANFTNYLLFEAIIN